MRNENKMFQRTLNEKKLTKKREENSSIKCYARTLTVNRFFFFWFDSRIIVVIDIREKENQKNNNH